MMLVTTKRGQCIVLRQSVIDAELPDWLDQYLGGSLSSVDIVAMKPKPITLGDCVRMPTSLLETLGSARLEQLEYQAYDVARSLVDAAKTESQRDTILIGYHDVARIIFNALKTHEVIEKSKRRIFVVEDETWTLLSRLVGSAKSMKISLLLRKSAYARPWTNSRWMSIIQLRYCLARIEAIRQARQRFRSQYQARRVEYGKLASGSGLKFKWIVANVFRNRRDRQVSAQGLKRWSCKSAIRTFRRFRELGRTYGYTSVALGYLGFLRRSRVDYPLRFYYDVDSKILRIQLRLSAFGFILTAVSWAIIFCREVVSEASWFFKLIVRECKIVVFVINKFIQRIGGKIHAVVVLSTYIARDATTEIGRLFALSPKKPWLQFQGSSRGVIVPSLKVLERVPTGALDTEPLILVTVTDSGSRVNLEPTLSILEEFRHRGVATVVFTGSGIVADEVSGRRLGGLVMADNYHWIGFSGGRPPPVGAKNLLPDLRILIKGSLNQYWSYLSHRAWLYAGLLNQIGEAFAVKAVLSINETWPSAVAAGLWARRSNVPWIGHFPILLGCRPDCHFFPADEHLAYGEQLRDHMISAGVEARSITVVGSQTYDRHRSRNRVAARAVVEQKFLRARNKKLVLVATEAFPDPEIEFGPIMMALSSIPEVHVILKLHPDDSVERFEALAIKFGVSEEIDIVKAYLLSELLAAADLLICVVSNIVIEAAIVGTPTLVCDFIGRAKVLSFVEEGLCLGCTDPALVRETVMRLLFDHNTAKQALELMERGLHRFNGPNDGRSSERIVDIVLDRAKTVQITSSTFSGTAGTDYNVSRAGSAVAAHGGAEMVD
jgi:UDP-N-acetylglucosamine 2-epimerase